MKVKTALIRNGHHMRPLLAVLKRYGIGAADKYGRGLWISENDLDKIEESVNQPTTEVAGLWKQFFGAAEAKL